MLDRWARSLARRGLRRIGLQRIHHPSFVDLMRREGIGRVFDVGANAGHYAIELREQGFAGHIVSFEPSSSAFAALSRRASADGRWEAHRLGLGDRDGELELSVAE